MTKLKTLSKLFQIKEQQKEDLELQVKRIGDIIKMEQERLNSLENKFSEVFTAFDKKQEEESVNIYELGLFYNYFSQIHKNIDNQKMTIAMNILEMNNKQDALIEAYKEEKVFEKMKEKILQKNRIENTAAEQKEIDSLFALRRQREE